MIPSQLDQQIAQNTLNLMKLAEPDLDACETFTPQAQVDTAYVQYLEARKASLERAIAEARYYLDLGAPGRSLEILRQVQTS